MEISDKWETATPAELEYMYGISMRELGNVQTKEEMLRAMQFALPFFFSSVFERLSPLQQTEMQRIMNFLEDAYGEITLDDVVEYGGKTDLA
jgi:hypothetical protein